jgi:2-methylcitrate dehydratase PrpD
LLAQRGMTAGPCALDGKFGYIDMFNGKPFEGLPHDGSNAELEILTQGLVYKMYPCCGGLHSQIDNILELKKSHGLDPAQVAGIECRAHPDRVDYLDRPGVSEGLEAKFSIQYCVATALLDGKVGLSQFTKDAVMREATHALMKKIRLVADRDVGGFGSQLVVRTVDGRELRRRVAAPRGSADSPFSDAELLRKFIECASAVMPAAQAEKAGATLMALDEAADTSVVVRELAAN